MLEVGKKFCNLFTDLLNPTSNSIYQKIGFRKIGESKHFKLTERKGLTGLALFHSLFCLTSEYTFSE
jgi:hypothetical protein